MTNGKAPDWLTILAIVKRWGLWNESTQRAFKQPNFSPLLSLVLSRYWMERKPGLTLARLAHCSLGVGLTSDRNSVGHFSLCHSILCHKAATLYILSNAKMLLWEYSEIRSLKKEKYLFSWEIEKVANMAASAVICYNIHHFGRGRLSSCLPGFTTKY